MRNNQSFADCFLHQFVAVFVDLLVHAMTACYYYCNYGVTLMLDDKLVKMLSEKNIVFIATLMPDGSPHLTPVWANCDADGFILINTAAQRVKHKNVLRDPRVALSLVSRHNPLDMVTIRGTLEEIIPDSDYKHIDKLAQQYLGVITYPFKRDDERRIILKIKPGKIFVMPASDDSS